MKKFRQKLKLRVGIMSFYNLLLLILVALGLFHPTAGSSKPTLEFMSGFNVAIFAVVQISLVYFLVKYFRALRDEDKLETLYIYENDERRKFIQGQIGGVGINILLACFALGTIGASFFNEIVYFSLLATLVLTALVKGSLKQYFIRKV